MAIMDRGEAAGAIEQVKLLKKKLQTVTDSMAKAVQQAERYRAEREELQNTIRRLEDEIEPWSKRV